MTSRKKITAITKGAKKYNCAVYLKTGAHPSGIMLAESDDKGAVDDWVRIVKVGSLSRLLMSGFLVSMPIFPPSFRDLVQG